MKKLHKWFIKWIMKKYGYTIHQCSCKDEIEKPKILLTTELFYETNKLFIDALIKTKTIEHHFDPNIVIHGAGGYICEPKKFDLKFKP